MPVSASMIPSVRWGRVEANNWLWVWTRILDCLGYSHVDWTTIRYPMTISTMSCEEDWIKWSDQKLTMKMNAARHRWLILLLRRGVASLGHVELNPMLVDAADNSAGPKNLKKKVKSSTRYFSLLIPGCHWMKLNEVLEPPSLRRYRWEHASWPHAEVTTEWQLKTVSCPAKVIAQSWDLRWICNRTTGSGTATISVLMHILDISTIAFLRPYNLSSWLHMVPTSGWDPVAERWITHQEYRKQSTSTTQFKSQHCTD